MSLYLVDTWYLIALLDRSEPGHRAAARLDASIPPRSMVTHEGVLTELLAFYSGEGVRVRDLAARITRRALREYTVVPADRALFLRALERYERRPDKEYSLVDCMSMVLMEERGIRHVLTNDHHFTQAGFILVNE
ncbi:MAG TPA: PIN domain-containing protein [Thermoanaerobaculia bacterium]|nr:PIN domain-containing protein [Thermoanaerobaculia bacterium]